MADEIINKVAQAQIEQIDLMDFVLKDELLIIDLKGQLWNEMVLKEKDFREWVRNHDWEQYEGKIACIYCSNEAILPAWSFMLVATHLEKAVEVIYGNPENAKEEIFFKHLSNWNIDHLKDKRVMVKGCSTIPNPNKAYVELTKKLIPVVKSLMFGEPCSAVPVFKKK